MRQPCAGSCATGRLRGVAQAVALLAAPARSNAGGLLLPSRPLIHLVNTCWHVLAGRGSRAEREGERESVCADRVCESYFCAPLWTSALLILEWGWIGGSPIIVFI